MEHKTIKWHMAAIAALMASLLACQVASLPKSSPPAPAVSATYTPTPTPTPILSCEKAPLSKPTAPSTSAQIQTSTAVVTGTDTSSGVATDSGTGTDSAAVTGTGTATGLGSGTATGSGTSTGQSPFVLPQEAGPPPDGCGS